MIGDQINPAHTAAAATTADSPFRSVFPVPRTTPALVDCVGVLFVLLPVGLPLALSPPVEVDVGVDDGEEEADAKIPPATLSGVVEFEVFEAARA